MALNLDKPQKITVSVATLAAGIVGLWYFHGWLGGHLDRSFFSEAQAQGLSEQVKQAADAAKQASQAASQTSQTLTRYITAQEVKTARERLNILQGQLSETQLWEASNAPNDISRARKADLQSQIEAMKVYISCLERSPQQDCSL